MTSSSGRASHLRASSADEVAAAVAAANAALNSASNSLDMTSAALATFAAGLSPTALQRADRPKLMTAAEAETTEAVLLPNFLTPDDIQAIFEAASSMPTHRCESTSANHHDVVYCNSHVALNLHRDGFFAAGWPLLCSKITCSMQASAPANPIGDDLISDAELSIRCIEFHTCE